MIFHEGTINTLPDNLIIALHQAGGKPLSEAKMAQYSEAYMRHLDLMNVHHTPYGSSYIRHQYVAHVWLSLYATMLKYTHVIRIYARVLFCIPSGIPSLQESSIFWLQQYIYVAALDINQL